MFQAKALGHVRKHQVFMHNGVPIQTLFQCAKHGSFQVGSMSLGEWCHLRVGVVKVDMMPPK